MERVRYAGDFKETTRDGVASNSSRLYFFYNVARTDFVYTLLQIVLLFLCKLSCRQLVNVFCAIYSLLTLLLQKFPTSTIIQREKVILFVVCDNFSHISIK